MHLKLTAFQIFIFFLFLSFTFRLIHRQISVTGFLLPRSTSHFLKLLRMMFRQNGSKKTSGDWLVLEPAILSRIQPQTPAELVLHAGGSNRSLKKFLKIAADAWRCFT